MKAILLVDHGSIKEAANRMIDCVGHLVQSIAGDAAIVRVAHMELAEPTIAQGFAACIEAGATEVVVFPYMLSPGKHSTRDIPRMAREAAASYPHVSVVVTPAFGVHEKLAHVVLERAGVEARGRGVPAPCTCVRPEGTPERWCGDACREAASNVTVAR